MPERRLDLVLAVAGRRLRLRAVARAVGFALAPAGGIGVAVVVVGRLAAVPRPVVAAAGLVAASAVVAGAAGIALVARGLDRRSTALLVDRLGGTDEVAVTALHVRASEDPNRDAILARVHALPDPRRLLAVRVPRVAWFAVVPAVLAALALAFVPPLVAWPGWGTGDPAVTREGERLDQRLAELGASTPEGAAVPEDLAAIRDDARALADDLSDGALSSDEAREQLDGLEDRLAAFERKLEPSSDLLDDLEQAARALDQGSTDALAEALRDRDLAAAGAAAEDLAASLAEATPEERARAAEALDRAGEALKGASDPSLKRAGEALGEAASQMASGRSEAADDGEGDGASGPGRPDAGQPGGRPLSQAEAKALGEQLAAANEAGARLARDEAALERSQQLNGALEGARQRLGGDARVSAGHMAGAGQGEEGPPGSGDGPGGAASPDHRADGASTAAGQGGHTWEDQGEFSGQAHGDGADGDRMSDRQGGQHVDDFQRLYDRMRLQDADALLAGVGGQIDDRGHVDQLPIRITSGDEDAQVGTAQIPAEYRAQAAEAIDAEPIPPAYEQAVKRYFDVR